MTWAKAAAIRRPAPRGSPRRCLLCTARRAVPARHIPGVQLRQATPTIQTNLRDTGRPYRLCDQRRIGLYSERRRPDQLAVPTGYSWPNLTALGFNGIATIHSQITEAMIPDNKETTYLIGEKYMSPDHYITGDDPGDLYQRDVGRRRQPDSLGQHQPFARHGPLGQQQSARQPTQIFGSSHAAGWHAAFCDGHVQLIGWGIDGTSHQAMATRNGHEVVDPSKIPK